MEMNSRYHHFLKALLMLMLSVAAVSCQDSIPRRATISPTSAASSSTGGSTTGKTTLEVRPTNSVKFNSNFCACKDGKAITFGTCSSFCASKQTAGKEVLYASFTLKEDILLNAKLKNLLGWCTADLDDGITANAKCLSEVRDENGTRAPIDVTIVNNTNSVTIDITDLEYEKTFVLTVYEESSGARSDSIQFLKTGTDTGNVTYLGPLKISPISQYTCLWRKPAVDNGDLYFDTAFRMHYNFLPRLPPAALPANSDFICHDIFNPLYGAIDDPLFPRLELVEGAFNLWNLMDPRFYDNNENNNEDVNDQIIAKAKIYGVTITPGQKFFSPYSPIISMNTAANGTVTSGSSQTTAQPLGWYMSSWVDATTYRSYCLNSSHYNSSNGLFKAMRDIVGVDTEGLYIGYKAPQNYTSPRDGNVYTSPFDILLLKESDLKRAWFYLRNGVPTVPTDENVASVAVYFYYPFNFTSPYVKGSTQSLYQVMSMNDLQTVAGGSSTSTTGTSGTATGSGTQYPAHDRKIGCIPKF
jgi:hypothetical protein